MKLSEKRQQAVYNAIHSVIMDTRVELNMKDMIDAKADYIIAQSINKIWRKVQRALNLNTEGG